MIRRISALGAVLCLVSVSAAWADDPVDRQEFEVPPAMVVEEEVVVMEEPVQAPPPPYVAIQSTSVGAGIGIRWGEGILTFEGRKYDFSVRGLSVGDLGAARVVAAGDVDNLEDLGDFEGRYLAVEAGFAAGVGASVVKMRNERGVVIKLQSDLQGAQLTLGAEGFSIALK